MIKIIYRVLLVAIAVISAPAISETYYVDGVHGHDDNAGASQEKAWKSMPHVNEQKFIPGDWILFRQGQVWNEPLRVSSSGSAEAAIVYGAYGEGAKPVIDIAYTTGSAFYCDQSYIVVRDLVFKNAKNDAMLFINAHGVELSRVDISFQRIDTKIITVSDVGKIGNNGIAFLDGGSDIKLSEVTVANAPNNGVLFRGHPTNHISNVFMQGSYVHDAVLNDCITVHEDCCGGHAGKSFEFIGNRVERCGEQGLDISTGQDVILRSNISRNNGEGGIAVSRSASGVIIDSHLSEDEPLKNKAAAVIIGASNVQLKNSVIKGFGVHLLAVMTGPDKPVGNINITGNKFEWAGGTSLLDIAGPITGLTVKSNRFTASWGQFRADGALQRVIRFRSPEYPPDYSGFVFDYNRYESSDGAVRFQAVRRDAEQHSFNFDQFQKEFKQESHGSMVRNLSIK